MAAKGVVLASSPMVRRLSISEARNDLGAVVKRIHANKEYLVLEKDGVPVAGLMDIDKFEDYLELQDPKVRAIIRKGRDEYLAGKSRPARELLRELEQRKRGKATRRQKA